MDLYEYDMAYLGISLCLQRVLGTVPEFAPLSLQFLFSLVCLLWGNLDLEVGRTDAEFGCCGDVDCACISLLG